MEVWDVAALILVYALIAVTILICTLRIRKNSDADIRKPIHILIGNFVFVWWLFSAGWIMLAFFVVPFGMLVMWMMIRKGGPAAIGKATSEGSNTGLLFYVISIGILVALFFDHFVAASVGIAAMTYGDSMGSVIGKRFGKHKTFNQKSLEGSLAVFVFTAISAFVVILFYMFIIDNGYYSNSTADAIIPVWAVCILSGAVASVLEALSPGYLDNLIIPTVISVMLCMLGM